VSKSETGIKVIPPLIFLAAFIVAFAVDWLWPLGFGLPLALRWILGIVLIAGPIAVASSLFAAFRRTDSAYDVRKVPKALVTEGAFRYSRNPGYLGLIVLAVGVAILFDNPWVLLAIVPAAAITHYQVILKEEAVLEREFGDAYRQYKNRVRRWI